MLSASSPIKDALSLHVLMRTHPTVVVHTDRNVRQFWYHTKCISDATIKSVCELPEQEFYFEVFSALPPGVRCHSCDAGGL